MKVIDLLNKIANGEEVPKRIMIDGHLLKYNYLTYLDENYNNLFYYLETSSLNDEVEIIEDTPKKNKIDKLYTWFHLDKTDNEIMQREEINTNFKNITEKIDEIIDYINGGKNDSKRDV